MSKEKDKITGQKKFSSVKEALKHIGDQLGQIHVAQVEEEKKK